MKVSASRSQSLCLPLYKGLLAALLPFALCTLFLQGCRNTDAENAQANLKEARALIQQGSYTAAFLRLNLALQQSPKDPDVHLNLGWLLLYTGDLSRAESECQKADELAPNRSETMHLKGSILSEQAQRAEKRGEESQGKVLYRQASQYLERALKMNAGDHKTYFELANADMAIGEAQRALDALDAGFDKIPKSDLETQVEFEIASCTAHAKLAQYAEAIADCKQAQEFTTSEENRQRIEDLIENMRLLNPPAQKNQNEILHTEALDTNLPNVGNNTGSD